MAPQGAPHRRGGTHRVKDQDRTNTVYDEWDYKQLKSGCVERGIYVKDMKKVEMAKALANYDVDKRRAERSATIEHERKQKLLEVEKRKENEQRLKKEAAKHKRRMEKEAKRERDESVSDDTPDEDEIQQMHDMMIEGDKGPDGQALSEESWDSTSTEMTICSTNPTILPECKLRLFEWSFSEMPSPTARSPPSLAANSAGSRFNSPLFSPKVPGRRPLPIPRNIPYAPLKVHTTKSKEKLFLPGQTYPLGIDPDFVPVLSHQTRHAARNGVLEGVLRKATVERATVWTNRTQIQGWNARIFFSLAPRNKAKELLGVYNKWFLENRKLLRVEPRGDGLKVTREQRHIQRHRNKGKKLAEVLEASEYRSMAVCYLPAYLDYRIDKTEVDLELQNERRTLENLFFVRFQGCDVPHYYFWTRKREWADPTSPNPGWTPEMAERGTVSSGDENGTFERPRLSQKRLPGASPPVRTVFTRIKNTASQPPPLPRTNSIPDLATTVALIEFELYTHGLAMTLVKYRNRWLAKGQANAWTAFGSFLPLLYPSGTLPTAPPVRAESNISIAMKLASMEKMGDKTLLPPLKGDEPWTKNDDAWWDVVEVDVEASEDVSLPNGVAPEHNDLSDEFDRIDPKDLEALYRRGSIPALPLLSAEKCASWIDQVSPSFVPLTLGSLPSSPILDEVDARVREEWVERFLQDSPRGTDVTCPFCLLELGSMSIENQSEHMYSHSIVRQANHRRVSSLEFPLVALPPARRRPSYRIDTSAEAGNERTSMTKRPQLSFQVNTSTSKKRRTSQTTYKPAKTHSSHNPSSYLPMFRRYADDDPQVTWNSRKWSYSSIDSLEFLDEYRNKNRRTETKKLRTVDRNNAESDVSLTKFYALDRKTSNMLDPTYHPPTTPGSTSKKRSIVTKKRRKIADPTYRASAVSSSEEEAHSPVHGESVGPSKKRKGIVDPTYRDMPESLDSLSEEIEVVAPPRKKSKKRTDTSHSKIPTVSESNMKPAVQHAGEKGTQAGADEEDGFV